jgi:hypothetical protein
LRLKNYFQGGLFYVLIGVQENNSYLRQKLPADEIKGRFRKIQYKKSEENEA